MKGLAHQHLLLGSRNGYKTGGHLVLPALSTAIRLFRLQLRALSSIALDHQALAMVWVLLALPNQLHLLQILLAITMGLITGGFLSLLRPCFALLVILFLLAEVTLIQEDLDLVTLAQFALFVCLLWKLLLALVD